MGTLSEILGSNLSEHPWGNTVQAPPREHLTPGVGDSLPLFRSSPSRPGSPRKSNVGCGAPQCPGGSPGCPCAGHVLSAWTPAPLFKHAWCLRSLRHSLLPPELPQVPSETPCPLPRRPLPLSGPRHPPPHTCSLSLHCQGRHPRIRSLWLAHWSEREWRPGPDRAAVARAAPHPARSDKQIREDIPTDAFQMRHPPCTCPSAALLLSPSKASPHITAVINLPSNVELQGKAEQDEADSGIFRARGLPAPCGNHLS